MIQMFTTSRIQETKMRLQIPPLEYTRCLPPLEYRRQRCNMIQMFTTSRIQETKMQYDTNVYHLQNIGDKDAITNVYHLQNIGDKDAI